MEGFKLPWIITNEGYQEVDWCDAEDYEVFATLELAIEADERGGV